MKGRDIITPELDADYRAFMAYIDEYAARYMAEFAAIGQAVTDCNQFCEGKYGWDFTEGLGIEP